MNVESAPVDGTCHDTQQVSDVCSGCLRPSLPRIDVCLSQRVSACTFLKKVSVSVTLSLHMYEYVCMRAAVSPGAKWASAEQNGEKKLLMTHLNHTT